MNRILSLLLSLWIITVHEVSAFELRRGQAVRIFIPEGLAPVATTAYSLLGEDLQRVLDASVLQSPTADDADIVCSIDTTLPREGFYCHATHDRFHIEAADAHGLAYGLLEVSHSLGVSAWEDWADVEPDTLPGVLIADGYNLRQEPAVAFRGIFINDEDWGLNPWATRQEPEAWLIHQGRIKGAVGPKVTERIFRLMLRLHLNYYWPPMHECTQPFFLTPGNREMAARYGIYVGGSHCEPMASSTAAEWGIRGKGEYNYVTNQGAVQQFWKERLDSVRGQEIVYTLGMRGVHDGAMQGVTTPEEKVYYLQKVIDDQRTMLAESLGREPNTIPQVFVPYKEVLDIYRNGLHVPDDVTLMWTDDNYGYVRHFPDSIEQQRSGGNGLYYHVSYWGRPHDYCWLSTLSPYLMEHQLTESYHRGIRTIWMLNVGDIKPAELQINTFAQLAWRGVSEDLCHRSAAAEYLREMLFDDIFKGMDEGFNISVWDCLNESFRLAWDRKPEHMAGTRVEEKDKAYWNTVKPIEYWTKQDVEDRITRYRKISDAVEQAEQSLPANRKDAYFQLIRYPIQAAAQMNYKYLCPDLCQQAQDSIYSLTREYNEGRKPWGNDTHSGKWDGIMSASPRSLRVFQPVSAEELPTYDSRHLRQPLISSFDSLGFSSILHHLGTNGEMLAMRKGQRYQFPFNDAVIGDSITLVIHLLPNHPVADNKLSLAISVDNCQPITIDYETYDRSEEWKLNVLRNVAERIVTLPIRQSETPHNICILPLTEGVILDQIILSDQAAF